MKRIKFLEKDIQKLNEMLTELKRDIALYRIEQEINKGKDKNTNVISLKRKQIARVSTRIKEVVSQ